ncbi:MAG: hypothetical protein KF860_04545 [Cyclobacteriaceae bacterium]|nr:hypothetical protein [Cyclobacteriaceae bacterium]
MDSKIQQLLDQYWKCETSLEEEKELRAYFNENEVSEDLKETALLFKYFESQKNIETSSVVFENKIKVNTISSKRGKVRNMFFATAKIAAGVLVLVAATYLVRQEIRKSYPEEIVDTYSDPQLAFEETKKALMMISKTFGKAKQEAGKITIFNEAEQIIQKGTTKDDKEKTEKIKI